MTEPHDIEDDQDYVDGMTEDELEAFKAHKFSSPSGSLDGHWQARPEPISASEHAALVEAAEAAKVKLDAEGEPPEGFASWFPGPPSKQPCNDILERFKAYIPLFDADVTLSKREALARAVACIRSCFSELKMIAKHTR